MVEHNLTPVSINLCLHGVNFMNLVQITNLCNKQTTVVNALVFFTKLKIKDSRKSFVFKH